MKVVLDGGCGVGKTSLARAISEVTGAPVYRPFRGAADHISPRMVSAMQQLGLSVNGWEEDLYVADLLANVPCSVILDRSMPSAIAYNEMSSTALLAGHRRTLLRLWGERIASAGAVLVLVEATEAVRKVRSPERGGEWEGKAIRAAALHASTDVPGMIVWSVRTDASKPQDLAQALCRRIMFGADTALVTHVAGPSNQDSGQRSFS